MSASTGARSALFEEPSPSETTPINGLCALKTNDGQRVVVVGGVPQVPFAVDDRVGAAMAMVLLVQQGLATQVEVARAFDCSERTVRRSQRRYEDGGVSVVGRPPGYPKGRPRSSPTHRRTVNELKAGGLSNRAIAARLGVSEKAVRKLLTRLGWKKEPAPEQTELFRGADPNVSGTRPSGTETRSENSSTLAEGESTTADANVSGSDERHASVGAGSSEEASGAADANVSGAPADPSLPVSMDTDPSNRQGDRLMASLGLLDDAAPLFESAENVPRAGVLLAVPAIVHSGVLEAAQGIYGSIGPAFYGLRTTILALQLLALLRIKRPEGLKEHSPPDLGRLLGLDRAPEVKTLRRKLTRLAAMGRAGEMGRALAQRHLAEHADAVGFLYVDGHLRVYHGERELPKTHAARMRLPMPGTTDYWVNDAVGEPVLVITAPANAGLTEMLPRVLSEVRSVVKDRRVTIVFDRGGWSPKLFEQIIADGFHILTYRKQPFPRVSRKHFEERSETIDGVEVECTLADTNVRLRLRKKKRLALRQVTRLGDDGHQTAILTSLPRDEASAVQISFRMSERWRQENFFKYMREEYALDALVDYQVEDDDPDRDVPNPRRRALDAELEALRRRIQLLCARTGFELSDLLDLRAPARKLKEGNVADMLALANNLERFEKLEKKRAQTPTRVPVSDIVEGRVIKLATERKHLSNVLKAAAFRAETALFRLVGPHYKRVDDEGRTLIQAALSSSADFTVTRTDLLVTLAPQSSPHRTTAIAALCAALNEHPVRYPGTRLTLRFAVRDGSRRSGAASL